MKSIKFNLTKLKISLLFMITVYGCKKDDLTSVIQGLPNVKTISSDSTGLNTQRIFCEVVNEGDAVVTERGFVWTDDESRLPPTINSRSVKCGAGVGEYQCFIDSLNPGIKYYVRAYAKNSKGISYGQTISFQKNFIVGMNYPKEGGILVYVLGPLDSLFQQGVTQGLIMADTMFRTYTWGCRGSLIGTSLNFGTGPSNTTIISNSCFTTMNASSLCLNLVHSGKSDWFLPSKWELLKIYSQFPSLPYCITSSESDSITFWAYYPLIELWSKHDKGYQYRPNDELPARPFRYF
jgi:hypothetical protein